MQGRGEGEDEGKGATAEGGSERWTGEEIHAVKRWDEMRLQRYIYRRMREHRTATFPLTPTPLDLVVRLLNEQAEAIDLVRVRANQSRTIEQELADVRKMIDECETVDPDLVELPSGDFVSLRDVLFTTEMGQGGTQAERPADERGACRVSGSCAMTAASERAAELRSWLSAQEEEK